jgi:hypothetical protein
MGVIEIKVIGVTTGMEFSYSFDLHCRFKSLINCGVFTFTRNIENNRGQTTF